MKKLQEVAESLNMKHTFTTGQIVEWKPMLMNKKAIGPFVVVEVIDPPIRNSSENAGSSYFREPLDIVLGHIDGDGDFMIYHYDSRRIQPVTE